MDILGDHLSYVLLVVFGLFAVAVHSYSLFGQQIAGDITHRENAVLDSLSVLSLGGQYSVFRGFVFYLVVSESLYILLASSSMILQLTLNAMGRQEMAGALTSDLELNPLIPILASSVIISASQVKPLSQIENSIRRVGHRIAGIPRNVYEIQDRIKATSLAELQSRQAGNRLPTLSNTEVMPLVDSARIARDSADQIRQCGGLMGLDAAQTMRFHYGLYNIRLIHELLHYSIEGAEEQRRLIESISQSTSAYLQQLDSLMFELQDQNSVKDSPEFENRALAFQSECHELELAVLTKVSIFLLQAQGDDNVPSRLERALNSSLSRSQQIFQQRERLSTQPFGKQDWKNILGSIAIVRELLSSVALPDSLPGRADRLSQWQALDKKARSLDTLLSGVLDTVQASSHGSSRVAPYAQSTDWVALEKLCLEFKSDLVSVLSWLFSEKIDSSISGRAVVSSLIARYAKSKTQRYIQAGESLQLSRFRLSGFRQSLEKVYCLYEWTLGADGVRIWANHDTQQITLLFDSIKHKFEGFENDLNALVDELEDRSLEIKEQSVKMRWKEAMSRCGSLEDDLTLLLSLLLINKPDVKLDNYPLLDRLRDSVLERDRNHEMNSLGMSALWGVFLALTLITVHFIAIDEFKGRFRLPDTSTIQPTFNPANLGPFHKDYVVVDTSEDRGVLRVFFTQLLNEGGVRESVRLRIEQELMAWVSTITGSFMKAVGEVLDFLIIFCVATGVALTIRSMRKVERRWSNRVEHEPPPMYSYLFVGIVAYIISACLILLYRFTRIVVVPMTDTQSNLLSSTHFSFFQDSFGEYLLFPVTAFVVVWFVLEHMDKKYKPWYQSQLLTPLKYALLCTVINVAGKVVSDSYHTGWDVVYYVVTPTLGFFSFMVMFAYCMRRFHGSGTGIYTNTAVIAVQPKDVIGYRPAPDALAIRQDERDRHATTS